MKTLIKSSAVSCGGSECALAESGKTRNRKKESGAFYDSHRKVNVNFLSKTFEWRKSQ